MDSIKSNDNVLIIWHKNEESQISRFVDEVKNVSQAQIALENSERFATKLKTTYHVFTTQTFVVATRPQSTFDVVISNWLPPHDIRHTDEILAQIVKLLKPNGRALLKDGEDLKSRLKLNGFVNIENGDGGYYKAMKANFEVGSKASLNLKGQKPAVWKLEDDDISSAWTTSGNGDEVIDSDALLDEEDLKKPEKESLKVCATTGKRKACADCSCGLAEELRGETKETPKSSCGSCYLGDAFRCASCPYLGMPAFKPGEKVLLANLQPDL